MRWSAAFATMAASLTLAMPVMAQAPALNAAEAAQRGERMTQTFERWASAQDVRQGAIAVLYRGDLIAEAGVGGRSAHDAAPVASLSKAITALCASRLIDEGKVTYGTTVSEALTDFTAQVGPPRDPRLAGVTVGQLIGHRSGVPRVLPLATSRTDWGPGMRSSLEEQARRVFAAPLEFAPGERYEYSNQAYILLSYIIETAAGAPYEDECRRLALEPAGVTTARLDPRFPDTPRSGAGGWTISAADYARFADQFRDTEAYGPRTRAWLETREGLEPYYGLGFQRRGPSGGPYILTHNGLLSEPEVSASAQYAVWPSGLTIAFNVTPGRPRVLDELMVQLNAIAAGRAP